MAGSAASTDWPQIVALYDELLLLSPSPVIELNRAIAVGIAMGPMPAWPWSTRSPRTCRASTWSRPLRRTCCAAPVEPQMLRCGTARRSHWRRQFWSAPSCSGGSTEQVWLALLPASAPSPLPPQGSEHHDVTMSGASPGALWSRSDLRARAVSLVVLGVLVGLTLGLATAAYDGARRTDSALSRLQSRTNASDAIVFATQADLISADWSKLEKRPEVEQLVRWGLVFGDIPGDSEGVLFVPMDDAWLNKVDRPIVVAGRMFDPKAADEVIVSDDVHTFPDGTPMKVGTTVSFTPFVLGSSWTRRHRAPS